MKISSLASLTGPAGNGMENASLSPSPFTRRGKNFFNYIPAGEETSHLRSLMEEFPTGNRGSGPHCHL
jgi:hypothetical protein